LALEFATSMPANKKRKARLLGLVARTLEKYAPARVLVLSLVALVALRNA
jgi:hypothetical protein